MEKLPKVSVVIPFYSGLQWLYEAVDSALGQDYPNKEIILVNDGSKEDLRQFRADYADKIFFIDQENSGPAAARNAGIDRATGKYVAFLDADDLWLPGKLRTQIADMEAHDAVWGHHSLMRFYEGSDKVSVQDNSRYQGDVLCESYVSFRIQTGCVVVRREELERFGIRFPENMRYGEDGVFYSALARRWPLYYTDGVYLKMRFRGSNAAQRVKVQLLSRADEWETLRDDTDMRRKLPRSALLGFHLAFYGSKLVRSIRSETLAEWLSRSLYVLPYACIRLADRKLQRRSKI